MSFSNVPPRTHTTIGTIIASIRQSSANSASANCIPTASNTNTIFILLAFGGPGAELLRQETADPSSDLRVIFQSACEYDVTEMIKHLSISVHAVRAIGGAPATNLVIRQKFIDSTSDPSTGNRLSCDRSLFCAMSIRTNSPQQASALIISLRGSLPNPHSYRHVHKLIAKVCRSRPSRLFNDMKAKTPYESPLFVSVHKIEEISQNPQHQPRWFADFFSVASHMVHPGEVDRFLVDKQTANARAMQMYHGNCMNNDFNNNNFGQHPGTIRMNYSLNYQNQHQQQQRQYQNNINNRFSSHNNNNAENQAVVASDQDAMFVPSNSSRSFMATNSTSAANMAKAISANEPILLSRIHL